MRDQLKRWLTSPWLPAISVFFAGVLLCEVNVLAARYYSRWDFSLDHRNTLSAASKQLLTGMKHPVTVYWLKGSATASSVEARQLLAAYQKESSLLELKSVDPDRNPALFLSLMKEQHIGADALAEDFAAEAAFVVKSEVRSWLVRENELVWQDAQGRPRSRLEAALTEAIARTLLAEKQRACFVTGHGERSIFDESPEGLSELRRKLASSNIEPVRAQMDIPDAKSELSNCDALVIVAPNRPVSPGHAELLARKCDSAKSVLLFVDPIIDDRGQVIPSGLQPVARKAGAQLVAEFIIEEDPRLALPGSMGESFFALTKVHPVTQGLATQRSRLDARPLFSGASPVIALQEAGSVVALQTSEQSFGMKNLRDRRKSSPAASKPLSLLVTRTESSGSDRRRFVVSGTSSFIFNQSLRDKSALGNRVLAENVFAWAMRRPTLVQVPDREAMTAGLHLSEESRSSLLRYVLFYLPLASVLLALTVLRTRSRRTNARTEKAAQP